MKLSLAWIFDHIEANWKEISIDEIVTRFNAVTAETESFAPFVAELEHITLARVESTQDNICTVLIPEWNIAEENLSMRSDAIVGQFYMIKKDSHERFSWVTLVDFKVDSAGLMPAIQATTEQAKGSWRKQFEAEDIILEVDNKSITHRPDMWGHRGFAREIAAFMGLNLKKSELFLENHPVKQYDLQSTITPSMPYSIENKAPEVCHKYCGFYISELTQQPSSLFIASRLIKVGVKPRNGLVDITNYLMLDWSQPVHAYDATQIADKKIIIRKAHDQEKLTVLGDQELTLTPEDLIIADSQKGLCLAGVKGGKEGSISDQTTAVFFEAATFDPGCVRKSAARHKIRTDSSARFEKTLTRNQTVEAAFRFKKLLKEYGFKAQYAQEIIAIGHNQEETSIEVTHQFLESRSGVTLTQNDVVAPLARLGFTVFVSDEDAQSATYTVIVPAYRASKDIKIKEDILEEVIRFYGFARIPLKLPSITRTPFDVTPTMRLRKIKYYCAHALAMTEQQNYALFDEAFLVNLELNLTSNIEIVNPVSENMSRLVSSLIPGLLKNIQENHVQREQLAFFECAKTWPTDTNKIQEVRTLAGIVMRKHESVSFYEIKQQLIALFGMLNLDKDALEWRKISEIAAGTSWYLPYQTAAIYYHNHRIGQLGMIDSHILDNIDLLGSTACAFEINLEPILFEQRETTRMKPIIKFQETFFDVSIFVPLTLTASSLKTLFSTVDELIIKTELRDCFERDEWEDKRSLTFRFWLNHPERTLEKEDIDNVRTAIITVASAHGAHMRME